MDRTLLSARDVLTRPSPRESGIYAGRGGGFESPLFCNTVQAELGWDCFYTRHPRVYPLCWFFYGRFGAKYLAMPLFGFFAFVHNIPFSFPRDNKCGLTIRFLDWAWGCRLLHVGQVHGETSDSWGRCVVEMIWTGIGLATLPLVEGSSQGSRWWRWGRRGCPAHLHTTSLRGGLTRTCPPARWLRF